MKRNRRLSGFYFITDSTLTRRGVVADVREALSAGVALVQYREKAKAFDERRAEAEEILALCRAHEGQAPQGESRRTRAGVPLIINDDIALAEVLGAAGVHLGQDDAPPAEARRVLGPAAIVGVSVGNPDEARRAAEAGADYLAVGPVFETPTKPDAGPAVGIAGIRAVRAATELPLAAIGGMSAENIPQAVAAGADLVCAISASLAGGRVAANVAALRNAMAAERLLTAKTPRTPRTAEQRVRR